MRAIAPSPSRLSPILGWSLLALIAVLLALTPLLGQAAIVNWGGWPQFQRFFQASLHPDLSPALLATTGNALLTTLAYAACGSFLSLILGSILGLCSSEVGWQTLATSCAFGPGGAAADFSPGAIARQLRALLALPRAIHELIWGLILINIWGSGSLTGIIAIALPFGLITGKVFAEILDDSPRQAWQGLVHSGAHPWAALAYGLLPQASLNLLSYAFYRFECSLRSAAVLGMIGVGGLGTEILVSLQSLRYEQLWTFFYALVLLNGLVDWASARARRRLGCATRLDINVRSQKHPTAQRPAAWGETPGERARVKRNHNPPVGKRPGVHRLLLTLGRRLDPIVLGQGSLLKSGGLSAGLVLCAIVALCFWHLDPELDRALSPRSLSLAQELVSQAFPPDWQVLVQLPGPLLQTLAMSLVAIAVATFLGSVLAFLSARTIVLPGGLLAPPSSARTSLLSRGVAWGILLGSRAILLFARAIPAPVWALVLLYLLFPGILPGAIALAIHNLGILGRLKAEVIENLETPPLDSLAAQGSPTAMIFCYGILPLTLPRFLAYGFYRWEVCLRETVIVGLVGAGGLGYLVREQVSAFDYSGLTATLLGFMVLTWSVDTLSSRARQSLR